MCIRDSMYADLSEVIDGGLNRIIMLAQDNAARRPPARQTR